MDHKPAAPETQTLEGTMPTVDISKDATTAKHAKDIPGEEQTNSSTVALKVGTTAKGVAKKEGTRSTIDIPKAAVAAKDVSNEEGTMSTIDIPKDAVTTKDIATEKGTLSIIDVPKDAAAAKHNDDTTEEEGTNSSTDALMGEATDKDAYKEEGYMGFTDIPLNAVTDGDAKEDCTQPLSALEKPMKTGLNLFFMNIGDVFKLDELGMEIARIAIPAALALAADPLASLIDTAFIGRLGSVELAAVGVAIAIFNQVSKVAIYPLVSVTTSFVAEEAAICSKEEPENEDLEKDTHVNTDTEKLPSCNDPEGAEHKASWITRTFAKSSKTGRKQKYIPSVSSALVVGAVLGILQAILLISATKIALRIMGVKSGSPMLAPACRYLQLRSLGAPAVLLSLAMQGVFRGFKDTKTPLYATVVGDITNIILDPILIFVCRMGVSGAAIAHVLSQYLITLIMFGQLAKKVDVVPPSIRALKISRFLKCGFLLLARVIAVTFCVTLSASLAAHSGPISMAAFQICLQLWLATSLLADGLAVAGQAILATAFAKGDQYKIVTAASRVLQLSIVLGAILCVLLGVGMRFGSGIFTKDPEVVKIVHKGIPFVAATQPINALAFVFDGVNFGASDYTFSAYSMVAVAAVSIPSMFFLSSSHGFIGIWIALTIYMSLRTFASVWRMGAARGPWAFLRK